jgi:MOSC domain-containing protein YiiM
MGENITTRGLELLRMSVGTRLRIGSTAVVELTGLRNPCAQIESFKPGLLAAVLDKANDGSLIRKAGVMGVVLTGGLVYPGDEVVVVHHPLKYSALHPV